MRKETIPVRVPTTLYLDLAYQLRKNGDLRQLDEAVALAIKSWLAHREKGRTDLSYQWKDLFLPDGTELRMRYRGVEYYARIHGDQLIYAGEWVSPRGWVLMVTGTVRNPWRDIWIRRGVHECWTRACTLRAPHAAKSLPVDKDRRSQIRRASDQPLLA